MNARAESHSAHQLALGTNRVRLRAGERIVLPASGETLDFVRNAKTRTVKIRGIESRGFVFGPSTKGDEILLAASLTMEPGEYIIEMSATSQSGGERAAVMSVGLNPPKAVPSSASVPPVVLLNGYQAFDPLTGSLSLSTCPPSPSSWSTFGSLESDLYQQNNVPVVYFFDNCVEDPNDKIENLGNVLGQVLNLIRYDNGLPVPQIDLIAHSMGGLIVRSYLAGLQVDGSLAPPANPRVRKFIEIATPNFGSFLAVSGLGIQTAEMIPASPFLWNLATWNQRSDDLRGVDALAVIGNGGYKPTLSNFPPTNASDGVVSVSSASLSFARDSTRTRILPYCHKDFTVLDQTVVDCLGSGIAEAPETETIILSFLKNTAAWQSIGTTPPQDPWLSKYGGMYFADATASDQWINDLKSVSFGSTPLQFGGATGVVTPGTFFYQDLISGNDTFHFASKSLGAINCGPITEPVGYFTVWRCKASPIIFSVGPLLSATSGRVVQSGTSVSASGIGFGQQCSTCSLIAYPGPVSLTISSWTDQVITAFLPATFNGISEIVVQAASGSDAITFMAAPLTPPTISLSSTQLRFSYTIGGAMPAAQTVTVSNSGEGTLMWSATSNASWLIVASSGNTLTVSVNPGTLAPGIYQGQALVSANGATNAPQTIAVSLTVTVAASSVAVTSVTNAASSASGAIAPGEIVAIKGSGLGPATGVMFSVNTSTGMVDTTLAGTRVFFNGIAAPILYSSATQVNAIVPYEIAGQLVTMQVTYQGTSSTGMALQVASAAPGVFTDNSAGVGQAAASNQDGSLNTSSNPAAKGSYVTVYFTGGGQTNPPGATGSVTGSVLKWLSQSASVTVGGQAATIAFDGAAPTFVDGVLQLNIQLAANTPSGAAQPLVITVGGVSSSATATLAIQ